MGQRFPWWVEPKRSWWQQIKIHLVRIVLIAFLAVIIVLVIFGGYKFHWDWTGFNRPSKTLWDWLQLLGVLAVPVVVGFGAVWFTTRQGKIADAENTDNQREKALQDYIDKMSELLLHEKLRDSVEEDEIRKVARVRTLTILPRLDAYRRSSVLQVLYESGLIDKGKCIIDLSGADLRAVYLEGARLKEIDLGGAILQVANLRFAELSGASLIEADLNSADLFGALLDSTNLMRANLRFANLQSADLNSVILNSAGLMRANLRFANLRFANLNGAGLMRANLIEADLSGADLSGAYLKDAIGITTEELEKQAKSLKGAIMPDGKMYHDSRGANLREFDLSHNDLSGADLYEADLTRANLIGANLTGTNLTGANLEEAKLGGVFGITREELEKQTKSLTGATMPDGSIHP